MKILGVVLILVSVITLFRFLADIPESANASFILGYLLVPIALALVGLRLILKKK
jgi:lipopolysaccharide export LptBFGC system permease protein LptF